MHLRVVGKAGFVQPGGAVIESYSIETESVLIGRSDRKATSQPEIDLQSHDPDSLVSRRHAIVELNGATVFVQDIGSLNGTFLNGLQLEPFVKYELKDGDCIGLAKVVLRFDED